MVNSPRNKYNFGKQNVNVLQREQEELNELRSRQTRKKSRRPNSFVKSTRRVKARRKAELNLLKLKKKIFLSPSNKRNLNEMTNVLYKKFKNENEMS